MGLQIEDPLFWLHPVRMSVVIRMSFFMTVPLFFILYRLAGMISRCVKARLYLPVTMSWEATLDYRPDSDTDPLVVDKTFEGAGMEFLTLIIERMDEADNCLANGR